MRQIPVIVDSHLRLDGNLISNNIVETIFDELTIQNVAKVAAKKANRWQWEKLPDEYILANLEGHALILPRGYALQLKLLLRENGLSVRWIDRRQWKRGQPIQWQKEFMPREHQPLAVYKMRKHQQGMYEAPTGSGKSLTCLLFMVETSPDKIIILVDKLDLLSQWKKDIKDWLGIDCGIIGDKKWDDSPRIVIATVQTIWSAIKRQSIPEDFFKKFSCVFVDECHHVPADSIQNIVGRFWARIRQGVSATPDRKDDRFLFALSVLGEVFHKDDEELLRERGVLIKPHVQAVRTNFKFDFWPTHESDRDNICQIPNCKLSGKRPHKHQSNYQNLKDSIVSDYARNRLVCSTIYSQIKTGNHHHLIITDEVRHLESIYMIMSSMLGKKGDPGLYVLQGKVKVEARKNLIEEVKSKKSSVIIATVAKEGVDIPVVDRIYLPFPSSNPASVQQKIGRGTRIAEGKEDSIIFDFQDINVSILRKQFKDRANKCYRRLGLEVVLDV